MSASFTFVESPPATYREWNRSLYEGDVYLLSPNKATLDLVELVWECIRHELGESPRDAQFAFEERKSNNLGGGSASSSQCSKRFPRTGLDLQVSCCPFLSGRAQAVSILVTT